MAVTVTEVKRGVMGDLKYLIADITFDSSYPTNGEALTQATLGFTTIYHSSGAVAHAASQNPDGAVIVKYVPSTEKLQAFWDDDPTGNADYIEVDNATDLSAYSVRMMFFGK